jgi:large subunit ribosomal protein L29
MSIKELRDMKQEQLVSQLQQLRKELFHLRLQKATGELKKTSRFREVRREIARLLTVVSEQRLKQGGKRA